MTELTKLKQHIGLDIDDDTLIRLLLDKNRYFDKEFTEEFQKFQKKTYKIYNSIEKKKIRTKYYYDNIFNKENYSGLNTIRYTNKDIVNVVTDFLNRLNNYDSELITNSIKQRYHDLKEGIDPDLYSDEWLKIYNNRRANKLYSFTSIILDQKLFEKENYNEKILLDFINKTYDNLENYRHLAVVIKGEITNKKGECLTWDLLYKACIYAENFIQFSGNYFPFKKDKKINELKEFLENRNISNSEQISEDFYNTISTGYKYEDCYISDNQDCKILLLKKIELDESSFPCPSCCTTIQRGNSYPEMFLRSYECANPDCPDRSKSGRGKRFTEFSAYRYFKHVEDNKKDRIEKDTYRRWRRDVFESKNNFLELLISEYTYSGERLFIYGYNFDNRYKGRNIINLDLKKFKYANNAEGDYNKLPIVKLFGAINKNCKINLGDTVLKNKTEIICGNSASFIKRLKPEQIGTVMTSPPYYNAREYSNWKNMIFYFIDMFINCKTIYLSLNKGGYYLYNIGDIVAEDNVYVDSMMSNRRLPLGFLSCLIFDIAGYNVCGNIIWDKGEVQSKRNSTIDMFSGYVKCINCYEHVFVFKKGKTKKIFNKVERINPVIKINNKGINRYKHTAPYPLELVDLLKPFVNKKLYVLDPFLGSGTTLIWTKANDFQGLGIELNDTYFRLSKENIQNKNIHKQTSLF